MLEYGLATLAVQCARPLARWRWSPELCAICAIGLVFNQQRILLTND